MIINADILEWCKTYDGPKFHALLTDPPYHLTSIVDRFGKPGAASAQHGTDGAYARASRGFMNAQWDGVGPDGIGIAFRPETWAAIAEHLHPGAWGMAFAGSRGWHRMACAIEDAGLIIQPTIFGWNYSTGFPKATRIDTQIDALAFRAWLKLHPVEAARLKAARLAERAARRTGDRQATKDAKAELQALSVAYKALAGLTPRVLGKRITGAISPNGRYDGIAGGYGSGHTEIDILAPATEAAAYWLGHRYGGQALKPAIEPIIVFQKPYAGSPLQCMLATGAGALWIDGARIGGDKGWPSSKGYQPGHLAGQGSHVNVTQDCSNLPQADMGRWPANFVLSHHPACNGTCAPGCPVAALGAQSGELPAKASLRGVQLSGAHGGIVEGKYRVNEDSNSVRGHDDTGTAARFFFQADYMAERLELADAIAYVAKASRSEREAGLDPRQTALMRLLDDEDYPDFDEQETSPIYGNETVEGAAARGRKPRHGFDQTTVDDGRATPIDNPYQRGETTRRNIHPTIKPLSLCRHLATLLLPPAQYGPRRLLIPFSGAGSEVIGADLAGWEDVTGVELGADHVSISEARRAYWQQRRWELGDPARKPTVKASAAVPQGQLDMFTDDFMDKQRKLHQEWMANPPTFEEWHAATGGLREEYDRLSLPPMTHEEWLLAHESEAA